MAFSSAAAAAAAATSTETEQNCPSGLVASSSSGRHATQLTHQRGASGRARAPPNLSALLELCAPHRPESLWKGREKGGEEIISVEWISPIIISPVRKCTSLNRTLLQLQWAVRAHCIGREGGIAEPLLHNVGKKRGVPVVQSSACRAAKLGKKRGGSANFRGLQSVSQSVSLSTSTIVQVWNSD